LVPGKEYEIDIWSTTCGQGQVGPLVSQKLTHAIRVPPQSPGRVRQKERGGDFVEMCFQGPTTGHFTGFEVNIAFKICMGSYGSQNCRIVIIFFAGKSDVPNVLFES